MFQEPATPLDDRQVGVDVGQCCFRDSGLMGDLHEGHKSFGNGMRDLRECLWNVLEGDNGRSAKKNGWCGFFGSVRCKGYRLPTRYWDFGTLLGWDKRHWRRFRDGRVQQVMQLQWGVLEHSDEWNVRLESWQEV